MNWDFEPTLIKKSHYEKKTGMNLSHVIFHRSKELLEVGAICKWGRHWMVDPTKLEQFIREGGLVEIAQ